jgi:surface antigen
MSARSRWYWQVLGVSICLAMSLLSGVAVGAASIASASSRPLPVRLQATPSGHREDIGITVSVHTTPGAKCVIAVSSAKRHASFPAVYAAPDGHLALSWRVPSNAPSGRWTFRASCTVAHRHGHATIHALILLPGSNGSGELVAISTPRVIAGSLSSLGLGGGSDCDGQGICFPGDPFSVGQCTWYAAGRRPDLIGTVRGNADNWLNEARGRVPEGASPAVGAIAVWAAGSLGPLSYDGHVGYVAAISGNQVLIDDSNFELPPSYEGLLVHEHWMPANGIEGYIYGGPPGDGPGSSSGPGSTGPAGGTTGGSGSPAVGSLPAISGSTVVAQGPSNSLYAYWETSDAQWHGPLGLDGGGPGIAFSAPAISGSTVVAEGPSNSLYAYWDTDNEWHGPLQIGGAGTTYSAPSISGSTVVAQGPNNSLYAYWVTNEGQWHGPLQIGGAGTTYSAPSISGSTVVVQGPSNSLYAYWDTSEGQWQGPLGLDGGNPGIAFSAPSISGSTVVAEGPSNSLYAYWETSDSQWHGPIGLDEGKPEIAYSAPSISESVVVAQGPSNSVYAYWETSDSLWHGPLGIGGPF